MNLKHFQGYSSFKPRQGETLRKRRRAGQGIEQKHKEMASLEVETFTVTFSEAGMYE